VEEKIQNQVKMQTERGKVWYNYDADVLTVFATTPGKVILDSISSQKQKGSYFAETFCQLMNDTIKKKMNQSVDSMVKQANKIIMDKALGREVVQTMATTHGDIYLMIKGTIISEEAKKSVVKTKHSNEIKNSILVCANLCFILIHK